MYLMDSIIKNVGRDYLHLFTHNIVSTFVGAFEKVDESTRKSLFKLRSTWDDIFPLKKLYALDVRVNTIDPAWPIKALPPNINTSSIHVNPKFLNKVPEETADVTTAPSVSAAPANLDDAQEQIRQQLLAKQKQLLELERKKLELDLEQTKAQLAQASLGLNDPLLPPIHSRLLVKPTISSTVLQSPSSAASKSVETEQSTAEDPASVKDPGITSRDPGTNRKLRLEPRIGHGEEMQHVSVSDRLQVSPCGTAGKARKDHQFTASNKLSSNRRVKITQINPLREQDRIHQLINELTAGTGKSKSLSPLKSRPCDKESLAPERNEWAKLTETNSKRDPRLNPQTKVKSHRKVEDTKEKKRNDLKGREEEHDKSNPRSVRNKSSKRTEAKGEQDGKHTEWKQGYKQNSSRRSRSPQSPSAVSHSFKSRQRHSPIRRRHSASPSHSTLRDEAGPSQRQHPTLRDEAGPAQRQHSTLRDEAGPAQRQHSTLRDEAGPSQRQHPTLREEAGPAQRQHPTLRDEAGPAQRQHSTLRDEAGPAQRQHSTLRDEAGPAQRQHPTLRDEAGPSQRQHSTLRDEAGPSQRQHSTLRDEAGPSQRQKPGKRSAHRTKHSSEPHDRLTIKRQKMAPEERHEEQLDTNYDYVNSPKFSPEPPEEEVGSWSKAPPPKKRKSQSQWDQVKRQQQDAEYVDEGRPALQQRDACWSRRNTSAIHQQSSQNSLSVDPDLQIPKELTRASKGNLLKKANRSFQAGNLSNEQFLQIAHGINQLFQYQETQQKSESGARHRNDRGGEKTSRSACCAAPERSPPDIDLTEAVLSYYEHKSKLVRTKLQPLLSSRAMKDLEGAKASYRDDGPGDRSTRHSSKGQTQNVRSASPGYGQGKRQQDKSKSRSPACEVGDPAAKSKRQCKQENEARVDRNSERVRASQARCGRNSPKHKENRSLYESGQGHRKESTPPERRSLSSREGWVSHQEKRAFSSGASRHSPPVSDQKYAPLLKGPAASEWSPLREEPGPPEQESHDENIFAEELPYERGGSYSLD
ncbi:pre-mRNA cleavage complex 2 protein Pcf11-like isoform X2 [Heptranchias perlo]|uniref:pre-mRNA cleavage complex 2 protein Pcf11-like isoform X2 n=1 Tax=Heptranchias perlo TaxID=212740 RepID=UPI003559784C